MTCVSGDNPKEMHALWFEPIDNVSRCSTCIKQLFAHAPHYVPHFAHFSHFSFLMWLIVCAYRVHASCTCRKCRHPPQPLTTNTHYDSRHSRSQREHRKQRFCALSAPHAMSFTVFPCPTPAGCHLASPSASPTCCHLLSASLSAQPATRHWQKRPSVFLFAALPAVQILVHCVNLHPFLVVPCVTLYSQYQDVELLIIDMPGEDAHCCTLLQQIHMVRFLPLVTSLTSHTAKNHLCN